MTSELGLDAEITRLHGLVSGARRAMLTGPMDADGDSVGATLALASVLRAARPGLEVVCVTGSPIPHRYRFLDGAERFVGPEGVSGGFDLAFLLDGVRHRIGPVGEVFDAAGTRVLIDHHWSSNPGDYDLALLDVGRASTCEIVHEIATHPLFAVPVDRAMARQLYTGIAFDTGTFRYSCTTPQTLRLAADLLQTGIDAQQIVEKVFLDATHADTLFRGRVMSAIELAAGGRIAHACASYALLTETGAGPEGTEGLINSLVFIAGVEVAALFVERQPEHFKVSFRSRGGVNVAAVARQLSAEGGGHDRAAGVTLDGPRDAVVERVLTILRARLPAAASP